MVIRSRDLTEWTAKLYPWSHFLEYLAQTRWLKRYGTIQWWAEQTPWPRRENSLFGVHTTYHPLTLRCCIDLQNWRILPANGSWGKIRAGLSARPSFVVIPSSNEHPSTLNTGISYKHNKGVIQTKIYQQFPRGIAKPALTVCYRLISYVLDIKR